MDDSLQTATFLPAKAPKQSISDYSKTLSPGAVSALENSSSHLAFKAKVVILPKDFSPQSLDKFAIELAKQWEVQYGQRLLMVIDLKAHKVRCISSPSLKEAGISGEYISGTLIPNDFIPYIRSGDLKGAIGNTLGAIQTRVKTKKQVIATTEQKSPTSAPGATAYDPGSGNFFSTVGVLLILLLGLAVISGVLAKKKRSAKFLEANRQLEFAFREKLNYLYESADQIGQGSQFLDTAKYPELAQRIAAYFNLLSVVDQSKQELDLLSSNHAQKRYQALVKCNTIIDKLNPEGQSLLSQVNAVTGGVKSANVLDTPQLDKQKFLNEALGQNGQVIPVPAQNPAYIRPNWTMQNNYYQPLPTGATGLSMLDYLIFSNQIQTGLLLADLSAHSWSQFQHSPAANNTGLFGMGGGDWGGSTGSDIGGGDWGGSDMGGGDWGGDFGGGGDFGDGGGGW